MKRARRKRRSKHPRRERRHARRTSLQVSIGWIRSLAAPYLKGYRPVAARKGSVKGYWFFASRAQERNSSKSRLNVKGLPTAGQPAGFFVGYLLDGTGYSFLSPEPPECLVFVWVNPPASSIHRRLVLRPDGLVRKTFEYIRWLTHRPPRFVFHERELAAMTRHRTMRDWPPEKHEHFSRNFFIETLAWLVRSGLVRKLQEEAC